MNPQTTHRAFGLLQGLVLLTTFTVRAVDPYEPLCPSDFNLIALKDGSTLQTGGTSRHQRLLEAPPLLDMVEILRQQDDTVQFNIRNATDTNNLIPAHIYVNYEYNNFHMEKCPLVESVGTVDGLNSVSETFTATCYGTAKGTKAALLKLFVRSYGSEFTAPIPQCCHDVYDPTAFNTIEYIYTVECSPTCQNPVNYFDNPTDSDPTAAPTSQPTAAPTGQPTPTQSPPLQCSSIGETSSLSREMVMGSQLNGPHFGSRHPWAWPRAKNNGCNRYSDYNAIQQNAWPCYVNNQFNKRVLNFDSSYMNFQFDFDNDVNYMKAILTLGTETISLVPSGGTSKCVKPPDTSWSEYPIRLVKSGRYYHHWYVEEVNCNGGVDDTRIEIKVTSDCIELYLVSNTNSVGLSWLDDSGNTLSTSTNGFLGISYCVQCDSEINGSPSDALSGCAISQTSLPTDCCPLNPARNNELPLCGAGWTYTTCSKDAITSTPLTNDVDVYTTPSYPVTADGHSFQVNIPRLPGGQLHNDALEVTFQNNNISKWQKVKVNFHIKGPKRMTGISGMLVDPVTNEPSGIHIQMSKNWHVNKVTLYNDYWWTGTAHFRIPPGETKLKLVVAYQYYLGLHGVSHSQLSLLGWGVNGLWEEVGLGANGESITYEALGHHRRQMILDTRPWLTCGLGGTCTATPDRTVWTENHGGGDFLNAVNNRGMYQYLVKDTVIHTMNGPRLTNATYAGVTQDQNIHVARTVSTWTADDFVRHLHSFKYTFLAETAGNKYPRFALYTLGGDNYNYVKYPYFSYGVGNVNALALDELSTPVTSLIDGLPQFAYTPFSSTDAPAGCSIRGSGSCWFAMSSDITTSPGHLANRGIIVRNFHGRLNGQDWPPSDDDTVSPFSFSIIKSREHAKGNTVSIEIGLPNKFINDVLYSNAKFMEGDFLAADIELIVPPSNIASYVGNSQRLRSWYTEEDANSVTNGWKIVAREASDGDSIVTTVFAGELERKYHPRIKVNCPNNEARFNIAIPTGMPGILPITIAGVTTTSIAGPMDGTTLEPYLWRYVNGSWQKFADGGSYQLEKDVIDNSYTFVYSLVLEFQNNSSGPPVTNSCEQFAFAAVAPTDTNPNC